VLPPLVRLSVGLDCLLRELGTGVCEMDFENQGKSIYCSRSSPFGLLMKEVEERLLDNVTEGNGLV
jgi:hypothetical protein